MPDILYGFEGEKAPLPLARQLVKAVRGTIVQIPKEEKILYHIASVLASNYSVALLGAVDDVLQHMGSGIRLKHFKPLVKTSIENAFQRSRGSAVTGPMARGSSITVERHMRELQRRDRTLAGVYRHLGLLALKMAVRRKSLPPKTAKKIRQILES